MLSKVQTLFRTIRHLRPTQLQYRLRYLLLGKLKISQAPPPLRGGAKCYPLAFAEAPKAYTAKVGTDGTFQFLNVAHKFDPQHIDWNYSGYGKLWAYNLNYFEFLHQDGLADAYKHALIASHIKMRERLADGLEPYPISLRLINTIRFLSAKEKTDGAEQVAAALYSDACHLRRKLEYHLLGNHLLENGFALLMAAYFFRHEEWLRKAKSILRAELKEQIQADGGHFEQSPMYHCIMLHRVLEAIDLLQHNAWLQDAGFMAFMHATAAGMLGWLQCMTFGNGQIPMLNDAAHGIAPSTAELALYAKELKITANAGHKLGESGYRMWRQGGWELLLDAGKVANDYQPGHAHADTFSFELCYRQLPIIVDMGTSTYEKNERRQHERSTASHNTVAYAGLDSSEVWGGFRVGRRAKVRIIEEQERYMKASHDGYAHLGATHQRTFAMSADGLLIEDSIGNAQGKTSVYSLHFHPERMVLLEENSAIIDGIIQINFENIHNLRIETYLFAAGFNQRLEAKKIVGYIQDKASTKIKTI